MTRKTQRSMATAVQFLKVHGADPAGWDEQARRQRTARRARLAPEIEELAAETTQALARTREADVVDTFDSSTAWRR